MNNTEFKLCSMDVCLSDADLGVIGEKSELEFLKSLEEAFVLSALGILWESTFNNWLFSASDVGIDLFFSSFPTLCIWTNQMFKFDTCSAKTHFWDVCLFAVENRVSQSMFIKKLLLFTEVY